MRLDGVAIDAQVLPALGVDPLLGRGFTEDDMRPGARPVVLVGHGVLAEAHARVAGTITYELVCGIDSGPARARRVVVDG
jgi:hypothetical protein